MRWISIALGAVLIGFIGVAQAAPTTAPVSVKLDQTTLRPGQQGKLTVIVDVPPGLHAQSHTPSGPNYIPFLATMSPNPSVTFSEPVYPTGEDKNYPQLGALNVYEGTVTIQVPMQVRPDAPSGTVKLEGTVQYQMCDDKSCFMPQHPKFIMDATIVGGGAATTTMPATTAVAPAPPNKVRVTELPSNLSIDLFGWQISLGKDAYAVVFLCAFIVGILFNVMPCVLPVVPLKAMGFYEVSQHNRAKSLALGLVFSLGLVASFAVLGLLVVALQVFKWGELFSNTWFLLALVVVLVIMALSMFGVFTVNLPTSVYRWTPRHDTYVGNFLFGILTAALSTPCTFGMFFGLLAWALAQPVVIGVMLLVVVGMGMAFPYLILSAFPELARRFPRTGPWAETIKMLMGFLLLGTAAYFAGPFINKVLGQGAFWWVIFATVAAAAVFLVWRTIRFSPSWLGRAVSVVVALLMVLPAIYFVRLMTVKPYEWQPYTPQALSAARDAGHIVLVDFTADWCGNCHALEAFVLNSRRVVKTIDDNKVVMLKADVSADDAPGRPLLNELNPVGAIPLTAIYAPGQEQPIQLTGIYKIKDLQDAIARVATISSTRNPS